MEYYVYILKSLKDGSLYTGFTSNIQERLRSHNSGKVLSTRNKRPLKISYFEMCQNLEKALAREKYLKSSKAKELKDSLR